MTIAEIIAQGKRLEASCPPFSPFSQEEVVAAATLRMFYIEHGSRLLRIAEAAAALLGAVDACGTASEPSLSHYERIKATHGTLRAALEEDANA